MTTEIYDELSGTLATPLRPPPAEGDRVVYSDLRHGSAQSQGGGLSIKYVARGRVDHRVGRRIFSVEAGQFICVPEGLRSELEIRRGGDQSMIGMCVFLDSQAPDPREICAIEEPIVFPARCSTLGGLLEREIVGFRGSSLHRTHRAERLLSLVRADLEPLLEEVSGHLASLSAAKSATRHEGLRRLNMARGYLHDIVDRAVELGELARFAGISRFQLLRDFRACFGAPPATYHRLLRLRLAKAEIDRGRATCGQAAERFGFADSSSFSHAFRRAFGQPPSRAA